MTHVRPLVGESQPKKHSRHALEWWRDYPLTIPLYLVAAGLRIGIREARRRTGATGPVDGCTVPRAEALRLHAETFPPNSASVAT